MKKSIVSLLTLSTVALFSFPAFADNANVQKSDQVSTQVGNYNTTFQDSRQYNENRSRGYGFDSGSAQTSRQDAYSEGDFNHTEHYNNQENINRHGRRGR